MILSIKPIPHTAGVRLSIRLPRYGPVSPARLKVRSSGRIDQLSEWPSYYHLEIRKYFFFLLKRLQVYVSFAWACSGFGWWLSKSPFCRWYPTGGNYGSQLPRSSVWDGTALGTALTNESKLLEWSRRRTYSKQRFPALSHRVLSLEITFQRCKPIKVKLDKAGAYLVPLKEPTEIHWKIQCLHAFRVKQCPA